MKRRSRNYQIIPILAITLIVITVTLIIKNEHSNLSNYNTYNTENEKSNQNIAKMFNISIISNEENDEDTLNPPITCKTKIHQVTHLIFKDNDTNQVLGEKYIPYKDPIGTLPNSNKTSYTFLNWEGEENNNIAKTSVIDKVGDYTIKAKYTNYAPSTPRLSIRYTNTNSSENGEIRNGSETAIVTVTSSDSEDISPTINLKCNSGSYCSNIKITTDKVETNKTTFRVTGTKIGVAQLKATATDKLGKSSDNIDMLYFYGPGGANDGTGTFTNTDYRSEVMYAPEATYIDSFEFYVQFSYGHNNGSNNDLMEVIGTTYSGKTVNLYTWKGNMSSDAHYSDNIKLGNYNGNPSDMIRSIQFHTYSPHDSCATTAKITYKVHYKFDKRLM